jgi:peroxiredoxin
MKLANRIFNFTRGVRLTVVTVGLLTLFVFTPSASFQTEAVTTVAPKVADIKLYTTDGRQFSLASLRGQVVVLDFFAIKCVHSRDHIQETMTQFSREDFSRGLQIIGIESESSSAEEVRRYIQEHQLNYPVAQIDEATFVRFVKSRDLSAPQTLVFGRDGRLVLHVKGYSPQNEGAIRAAIQKALDKR